MTPVNGTPFCGDQPKAKVSLRLAGLNEGQYYALGEQLEGELTVIPEQDMDLTRIIFQLAFIIEGNWKTATVMAKRVQSPVSEILRKGQAYKFPVQIPYRFLRPSYKGEHLNSYWRLNVYLDYDPSQYVKSFVKRVLKAVTLDQKHGTSFEIPVNYGQGAYRASQRVLPFDIIDVIPLPTLKSLSWIVPLIFFFTFLMLDGRIGLETVHVMLVSVVVMAIAWIIYRMSIFQMTPMELQPLRDGQLRLRILDRGNDQLKKAIVGYRLLECYIYKSGEEEVQIKSIRIQKSFSLAETREREESFYEMVLPWPEVSFPPSGGRQGLGYEWEVFIQVPNSLTGRLHEKSWPIQVGWEQFRLAPPTEEELEQEELEVLKLKELEHLPRT